MTKKEIIWKVWFVHSCLWIVCTTVKFFLGMADIVSTICMFVCYSVLALHLILNVTTKIKRKFNEYILYKSLVNGLEYLKYVHKKRYKLYFTADREKIEEYSAEIDRYGNVLLNNGRTVISDKLVGKKHIQNVEEILNQTEKLMTTTK